MFQAPVFMRDHDIPINSGGYQREEIVPKFQQNTFNLCEDIGETYNNKGLKQLADDNTRRKEKNLPLIGLFS